MPTFVHGRKSAFKLDNAAGSLVDLSDHLDSCDLPIETETHETTAFSSTTKTYIPGLRNYSFTCSGRFSETLDAQVSALIDAIAAGTLATATFEYYPAGTDTGKPKYTGECFVTNYGINSSVGDLITVSLDLQVTGDVTRSTVS